MSIPNPAYWRRKLSAFLHDSPDKVIDLLDHEGRARSLAQAEGFALSETARKESDHAASAADRLPWPRSKIGDEILCRSEFDATDKAFRHLLGQAALRFEKDFKTALQALDVSHTTKPVIVSDDPQAAFLTVWRFWQNWASAKDERFAFLPAETRLPDHTIWNHLSVTSALQGCYGGSQKEWIEAAARNQDAPPPDRPAFLLFSLGPVQEFIAAARNTRDLWSGSYLLSYLIGSALCRIALDFGPDHVLYPNLLNQPILDLLLRKELWDHVKTASGDELWQAFGYYSEAGKRRLLTPSFPNRFLAVLPSQMTEHPDWKSDSDGRTGASCYAAYLAEIIRKQLGRIAESVADHLNRLGTDFNRKRFLEQSQRLLEIHWQVLDWPNSLSEVRDLAENLPGNDVNHPNAALNGIIEMVQRMPAQHRDSRYFTDRDVGWDERPGRLKQPAVGWSALIAVSAWRLESVKATRAFNAWANGGWRTGIDRNKDSLTGKEETCLIVPTDERTARDWSSQLAGNQHFLKPGDRLGAATLLKRFWHLSWLCIEHAFELSDFAMPNTRSIAAHEPYNTNADEEGGSEDELKYFAVLALDGDQIGKWISGVNCPPLRSQLSREAADYFGKHGNAAFLDERRPLSPSFHLQFSELLGNFSLHCARRIVEAFDGRLVYTGGDDVLAMLPADTALECARALRAAFRGEKTLSELAKGIVPPGNSKQRKSDRRTRLFDVEQEGFVKLTKDASPGGSGAVAGLLSDPVTFPIAVPGPAADCSVGIAIAHFKAPLQDVVRAAQTAQKRAKRRLEAGGLGRGAVAVTLFKRSGETIEWGGKWDSGGLEFYRAIAGAMDAEQLSGRFPYRVIELLSPYITEATSLVRQKKTVRQVGNFSAKQVIEREFSHALGRQRGPKFPADAKARDKFMDNLTGLLDGYLGKLSDLPIEQQLHAVIGLCQTVAFANRTTPETAERQIP